MQDGEFTNCQLKVKHLHDEVALLLLYLEFPPCFFFLRLARTLVIEYLVGHKNLHNPAQFATQLWVYFSCIIHLQNPTNFFHTLSEALYSNIYKGH